MAMEARLSLRQSQRVVMTPLLQQAIQLLQLSTLQLQDVVQKEPLENPLLEDGKTETPATAPRDRAMTPHTPPAPTVEQVTTTPRRPASARRTSCRSILRTPATTTRSAVVSQEDREDSPFENVVRNQSR
jgi:DNA-directed RNA polymerase specialized sigma54-like protein